jgi:hypothetical protein
MSTESTAGYAYLSPTVLKSRNPVAGKLHANLLSLIQQHSLRHDCVPEHTAPVLASFFCITVAMTTKF